MLWEELTAKEFPDCVKESEGICVLPIGVLEKHGNHLPVGTDMYTGQAVCKKAAEMEKSIVFPYYFLGQIAEARHFPGCISASHRLLMGALREMCDEICRPVTSRQQNEGTKHLRIDFVLLRKFSFSQQ